MESEISYYSYFKSSKLFLNDDNLMNHKDLSPSKNIEQNNIQNNSNYLNENSPKNDDEKCFIVKDEVEDENDKKIDNFLTKDIINSLDTNTEPNNNSSKSDSVKEMSIQVEAKSDENGKDFSQKNIKDKDDNINNDELKVEKEISKGFPYDLGMDKFLDFPIKNNFSLSTNNSEQVNHDDVNINDNIEINNENENNNCWNFNISSNNIFNTENQNNQHINESHELIDNNIHYKPDTNSIENNPIIKNKEITNSNDNFQKNEEFKLNAVDVKTNNEGYLKNKELIFDNNFTGQKFDLFQDQNNYINFNNDINNTQSQNNYIKINLKTKMIKLKIII